MNTVDPITIATIWHYIQRVCREMRETAERTATNVLIVTLHDMAYGIWDADGRVIAIPEGFPARLISSSFVIKRIIDKFKGDINPGDVFLTNYPQDGAIHLPDWIFTRPIFNEGELLFFTCMGTHVADSGGARAGTHFLAYDSIAEGLNIPLIKVIERGEWREDVIELILANNRLPYMMRREITSLVGSTVIAERRMLELLEKYDKDIVKAAINEMIERTEKAVRHQICEWPDGTYYAEVQTDDDGATMDVPITIRCKLTISDSELTFDFTESDNQVSGMINAMYQQTQSDVLCTTFLFLGTELAAYHNEGSIKPIKVVTKKGTIVDANPGALVAAAPAVMGSLTNEVVITVLSQALPDRAIAPYARLAGPLIVGSDKKTEGLYVYTTFCANAGAGAVTGYDGYQCCCDIGTLGVVSKSDAEDEMSRFPWIVEQYEFRMDAEGAGKWRSSPGIVWKGLNLGNDCTNLGGAKSGFTTQAPGQHGGEPTQINRQLIIRGNKTIQINHPHVPADLEAKDHFIALAGGGAGLGRPEERDPEAVRRDVINELVSIERARNIYKVAINPDTLEIDRETTSKLREKTDMNC